RTSRTRPSRRTCPMRANSCDVPAITWCGRDGAGDPAMWLDRSRVERWLSTTLGVNIGLALTDGPLADRRLGRTALNDLLARRGENLDTSRLVFPHPCFSLSHSRGR